MLAQVAPYERPALSKAYLFPECKFVMLLIRTSLFFSESIYGFNIGS